MNFASLNNLAKTYSFYSNQVKKNNEIQRSIVMESTQEILSRLKLLSHIQKGEKIGSRNMSLQQDGWFTRFDRSWINPDNRNNTLKLLRDIVSRTFDILIPNVTSSRERDIIQCKLIIKDLIKSQAGILNLKNTYICDKKFGCDLDILCEQIIARLAEIRKDHPTLFDIEEETKDDNSLP